MKTTRTMRALSLAVFAFFPLSAAAFPIAIGGEGASILVGGSDDVLATYLGNSAAFSNDLYLARLGSGDPGIDGDNSNDLFIFNNHSSPVLSMMNLGAFAIGTELIFRLHVNDTGYDYFSGSSSRNPDGRPHARVQENWMPNETLVSFEDLFDLPEYPGGFNDLSFSFSNTVTTPPNPSPEPMTLALLGMGLAGLTMTRRRQR